MVPYVVSAVLAVTVKHVLLFRIWLVHVVQVFYLVHVTCLR